MDIKKMLELYSLQRHDFLNHLQVISGLLQLNKQPEAMRFIREVGLEISRLNKVIHLQVPEAAAAFLVFHSMAAECQLTVTYDITVDLGGCGVPGEKLGYLLETVLSRVIDHVSAPENPHRELHIRLCAAQGGYDCVVQFVVPPGYSPTRMDLSRWKKDDLWPYGAGLSEEIDDGDVFIKVFIPAAVKSL